MASQNRLVMATPISSESTPADGREVGENSRLEDGHGNTREELQHPLGDGRDSEVREDSGTIVDGDAVVRVSEVLERFHANTKLRLGPRAHSLYSKRFRDFAEHSGLAACTKRQLAGRRGKIMLLDYLATVPRPSWQCVSSFLKSVWIHGVGLPWPIDMTKDVGKLPRVRRRTSPRDELVRQWARALSHETDQYDLLIWLMLSQFGWRPSHLAKMRWRNVRVDASGRPDAILADGTESGFKTGAPVAAWLPPDVVQVLEAWRKELRPYPEHPILPWRSMKGRVGNGRPASSGHMRNHLYRIRKKWGLPAIRPVDCRHWVATTCRKAGLSKAASAYLMGHDPTSGESMRDWYDAPQVEDILAEQAQCMPRGPLGTLEPPEVKLVEGLPTDAVDVLRQYLAGQVGTMELATRLEEIRMKAATPPGSLLKP